MNSTTMQEIDDMIDSLPNPKMADGYTKDSRAATKSQLNATANSANSGSGKPPNDNNANGADTPSTSSETKG